MNYSPRQRTAVPALVSGATARLPSSIQASNSRPREVNRFLRHASTLALSLAPQTRIRKRTVASAVLQDQPRRRESPLIHHTETQRQGDSQSNTLFRP